MSLGAVLDVAIGLALVYLLLGMIASAVQETCAAALKWRGKQLRDGIKGLLAGTDARGVALDVANRVFGHALVQGIGSKGLPSYVPARNVATAIFEVLADGSQAPLFSQIESSIAALPADMPARQSLTALVRQAGGDLDKLRSSVETWYADAMDRLSGDYKRWSHYFALAFGLVVAIVFNVSTFTVAHTLWIDPQARAAVVAIADKAVKQNPASADGKTPQDRAKDAVATLESLPLPIGWPAPKPGQSELSMVWETVAGPQCIWLLLGWCVTAFAVSLGAPFWFDTLQQLVNLRGSGPKPAGTPAAPAQAAQEASHA